MNVLCCYIFLLSFSSSGSSFITSFFLWFGSGEGIGMGGEEACCEFMGFAD
jgi:hypothetical protein